MRVRFCLALMFVVMATGIYRAQDQAPAAATAGKESVLNSGEVGDKLFPDKVFFRGQSATVQGRNSGGVRYADGFLVLAALVDNSGYSTGIFDYGSAGRDRRTSAETGAVWIWLCRRKQFCIDGCWRARPGESEVNERYGNEKARASAGGGVGRWEVPAV